MAAHVTAGACSARGGWFLAALLAWMRSAQWAYAEGPGRDLRLDLLRGLFVLIMVIDHVGNESFLTPFTGFNQFLVSAAEGFIFISGLVVGIVYRKRIARLGWHAAAEGLLRRAALLAVVAIGLTLAFVGLYTFTDVPLWSSRANGLGVESASKAVVGALTFRYSYNGTDILFIYAILLAAAPLMLYLLSHGRWTWVAAGSVAVWGVYQVDPGLPFPWHIVNNDNFPMATWQLLFALGSLVGYHRDSLARRTKVLRSSTALLAAGASAVGLIAFYHLYPVDIVGMLTADRISYDPVVLLFHKPFLGPGRVLGFFVFLGFGYLVLTRYWRPILGATGWLLMPLGQRALLAYSAQLFIIGPSYVLVPPMEYDGFGYYAESTLRQALAVGIVWLVAIGWPRLATWGSALPQRLSPLLAFERAFSYQRSESRRRSR
ncbi:MAG: OpgC domain-containing protein [Chloroflexi bacterium]|nr:OpgC domain-containing protein [Chloroflexota bacterium]